MRKKVFVVCGVTASGKSSYGVELGERIQGEIVNCDMAQCYSFLKIGSAAPTANDYAIIPHHLYSFINTPHKHSSYMHRSLIEETCSEIIERNNMPIIIGGSHFYLYCLLFSKIKNENGDIDTGDYHCHINDVYRNERKKESDGLGIIQFEPKYDYHFLLKTSVPSQETIKARILSMIKNGWVEEALNLSEEENKFVLNKKIIGYEDILNLNKDKLDTIVEKIIIKTNQYIKKQKCFIKKLKNACITNNIHWEEID